jgi:phospholipid/cholesterol/gamma-HCH transport system substrate-binding protein
MESKREQAIVGLFVVVATLILIGTVFAISGTFGRKTKTYHADVSFAGGLESGATVRYSGGPKVGRVEKLTVDPQNTSRIDIVFSVQADSPVKTDSRVKIMSISPLGDNHLEILPGSTKAPLAPDGALLQSQDYLDFNALAEQVAKISPQAQELLQTLNARATELKVTLDRANDLLSAQNRANLTATLANTRGMIEENRPEIRSAVKNVNALSEKLQPLLNDFRTAAAQANETLAHVDAIVGENRADVRHAVVELRGTLTNMTNVTSRLDQTLDVNSENIDELLDNLRHVTENLKEFTATIKARPYTLIRSSSPREHKPGEQQ